jgi:lysine decarboxylase
MILFAEKSFMNQNTTPLMDALKEYLNNRTVKFDVPGHKGGRGNPEITEFLGQKAMLADVNSMKPLDFLGHPVSVIKNAEALTAEAFSCSNAFFIVGGTTSSVQAMIMSCVKQGEKIIMPRNVHKSAINALILSGAVPVYVNPDINKNLGIPLGMSVESIEQAIIENPEAKAVLVNNPTYYGVCSDIKKIAELAHRHNMLLLADEAHGTHFYFNENLPVAAMKAGADMSAVSMHKTGGSLTQSSILLCGEKVNADYVRQVINLTQTTSGSYLLMCSLDTARKNLALHGKDIFAETRRLAKYARSEINNIGGYYAFCKECINGTSFFDFDTTKLSVHTRDIGLAGIEVYDILRDEYNIQIEFGDIGNILAIISAGDRQLEIERLVSALSEIKRLYSKGTLGMLENEYIPPIVECSPAKAFFSDKKQVPLKESKGYICAEFVMCYPPGIPITAPGEKITAEIIEHIEYAKAKGCNVSGTEDINVQFINIVDN